MAFSEPSPRWGHYSAAVGQHLHYVWGGRTKDFFTEKTELSVSVHSFNQCLETWQTKATTGKHPPALYTCACTSAGNHLYIYGGHDELQYQDSLYQLDTDSLEWSQLPSGLMKKNGCGMIFYKNKLVLFGGYGIPSTTPQQRFRRNSQDNNGAGWTSQLDTFDVQKGKWSSHTVAGNSPPPCNVFSFTKVDNNRAVLFGGYTGIQGCNEDVYILDLEKMHWSVLKKDKEPWPVGRVAHAAVRLWNGGHHPQLLVIGGMNTSNEKVLGDAWILDLKTGRWREVDVPGLQARCLHSATAFSLCPGEVEVTLFGGCPEWPQNFKDNADIPQIANTTALRFRHQCNAGSPAGEWILTDMAESSQLGTRQRIEEKAERMIEVIAIHREAERRLSEAEGRAAEGERRLREAEGRAAEGERRCREAEGRAAEAERRLREAESSAAELERRWRATVAEREKYLSEDSECELQQLETQWVVDRREIQLTGPELGRGGWATVSVATFRGVCVAAKRIHNQIISDYNIRLFKREMDMAARIRHPNLLQFIGATREGELVILTELMPTSLRAELKDCNFNSGQVISVALDAARALNYLHLMQPHPLIHRDISSANILLQPLPKGRWRAKVSDYGTVNLLQSLETVCPGNREYAAPEANHPTKQSPKMDIFSFGVLLVEMLTGEFPDSTNRARQLRKISYQPLLALVQRCLSQDRDNRPSASDIITELDS